MGISMPLHSGLAVPLGGLGVVLVHTLAVIVHEAEEVLGGSVTLSGGKPEPLHCFIIVLRNSIS